ncbi:hypothetical protein E2C01_055745 [Portunus trituberculatus]|uniref:Uncharacterized protein n=1 Tax=Portunus trituberculatus TaxID=210409 RepID=A0A5B7GNB7_PORTR|nr:hypothetical protein [Portunus trituberculatus]
MVKSLGVRYSDGRGCGCRWCVLTGCADLGGAPTEIFWFAASFLCECRSVALYAYHHAGMLAPPPRCV